MDDKILTSYQELKIIADVFNHTIKHIGSNKDRAFDSLKISYYQLLLDIYYELFANICRELNHNLFDYCSDPGLVIIK